MSLTENLENEYEALLQFLYLAPVGLIKIKSDGEVILINPLSAQLLLPITPQSDLSNLFDILETVAPEIRNMCLSYKKSRGQICDAYHVHLTAGIPGEEDPKVLSFSLLKLDADRIMAVISDVSLSVKRERQLQHNQAWFNAIFAGVTEYALMSLDKSGKIEKWNESIGRLTKFSAEQVEGKPYSIFFPADTLNEERMQDRLSDANDKGWSLIECSCLYEDQNTFWASTIITPLETEEGEEVTDHGYAMIIRDISDQKDVTENILLSSLKDHLTGLSNRRAFFDVARIEYERWKKRSRPLSLLVIDADHFKKINDVYGHPVGDEVLKHFASIMNSTIREMDIAARIGGEEFAALLPSTDLEGAVVIAERLRKRIADSKLTIDSKDITYTVSIGVSTMMESVTGIDMLLKQADEALYLSKSRGRNCVSMFSASAIR